MTDRDNITLPREVVEAVLRIVERNRDWSEVRQSGDYAAILRTALAAPRPEPSGYAYRYADGVLRLNDGSQLNGGWPVEAVPYWFATPALAAEQPKTPAWWRDGLAATLMREGVNKHRAREIAVGYWEAYCQIPGNKEDET